MRRLDLALVAFLVLGAAAGPAGAAGISGNFIVGQFSNPIFSGCVADAVNRSALTCLDTTSSAVYSIANSPTTSGPLAKSTLSQGANTSPLPGVPTASTVTFTGGTIPATHDSIPFVIGGISYTNGTSSSDTGIFGATLNLFASNGFTVQFIGSEVVQFNATLNTGTAVQNADYLTFSGLAGKSFEVLEGVTTTGSLNGLVIGDPVVVLTSLTLDPGQSASGFIAADPPLPTSIPEPVGVVLFGTGLVGLCALRSRKAA